MNEKDIEKLLAGVTPGGVAKALEDALAVYRGGLAQDLGQLATELGQLRGVNQAQAAAAVANTQAVWQNTVAQTTSGGGSGLASVGKTVWKVFGSGLTLSPLWKGLAALFGGSQAEEPAPLAAYVPPPTVRLEGQVSRTAGQEQTAWEWEQLWRRQTAPRPVPQITVQVQAMDSRSFLDHSEEIARAVREAMLHSHSLNDVVSEV
jgi:hypothetical protein